MQEFVASYQLSIPSYRPSDEGICRPADLLSYSYCLDLSPWASALIREANHKNCENISKVTWEPLMTMQLFADKVGFRFIYEKAEPRVRGKIQDSLPTMGGDSGYQPDRSLSGQLQRWTTWMVENMRRDPLGCSTAPGLSQHYRHKNI